MRELLDMEIKGYKLLQLVGSGGFGAVYRAHQAVVDREVAIKAILPHYANEPNFIRNFDAEAHLIARLEHPFIVPLFDYWREPNGAYLVMRYYAAGNLMHFINNGGALQPDHAARILEQVASALNTLNDILPGLITLSATDDAQMLLVASTGNEQQPGVPLLVDLATGRVEPRFVGHDVRVSSIDFSADGQYLLTGSHDRSAIYWDYATGAIVNQFAHDSIVRQVAFSPDDTRLLTIAEDDVAQLWEPQPPTLEEAIEWAQANRVVRELSVSECTRYSFAPLCAGR